MAMDVQVIVKAEDPSRMIEKMIEAKLQSVWEQRLRWLYEFSFRSNVFRMMFNQLSLDADEKNSVLERVHYF